MKIFKSIFGFLLSFAVLGNLFLPAFALADAPPPNCPLNIYFMVTDLSGKNITSVPNKDSSVILYVKLSTTKAQCSDSFNLGFLSINPGATNGFENIGSQISKSFSTQDIEYKVTWAISGLKDAITGQPVQNNGTVRFQAFAERQGYYLKSSTVNIDVKNDVSKISATASGSASNTGSASNSGSVSSAADGSTLIHNPLKDTDDLLSFFFYLLNRALAFVGILATVMIVVNGYFMVMSAGNPLTKKKGQLTVLWAVIGLVVTLLSFSIIALVQNVLRVK
jgi:hypothetical protein